MTEIKTRIITRNDSSSNWLLNKDVILLAGEMGIEFTESGERKIKIGDGVTTWENLPYFKGEIDITGSTVQVFDSYDAAVAAAADIEAGDPVVVVENGVATLYIIQPDKTLGEIGEKIEVNEDVFAHDADGKLNLYGFAEAVTGAQLVKSADGKLSWVKPDQTTIEGIETTIAGIESDIEDITAAIGDKTDGTGLAGDVAALETSVSAIEAEIGNPADAEHGTDATGLYAELDKKADASTVYTQEEVDTAIAAAVAAADHLKRIKVDSVDDIDPAAEGAENYIYMVPADAEASHFDEYMVIDGSVDKVGDWSVDLSEYVKTVDLITELEKKVDKVEGSRLMTNAEGTKLEGIEAGAQVNVIDSVDTAQFAIDENKNLTLLDIAMGKVTGLADALAAVENVIQSVDETQFAIDEDKKLTLLDIAMGKVTGLTEALAGKVDVVEGKGLSTNDLTDELLNKLNNADPNVIEIVKLNGSAVQVADDKSVDIVIPIATADLAGIVKSSTEENKVSVAADGTMEVNNISISKLVQADGEQLVLNGGSSAE